MENLTTPQYLSKTVEALVAENHPLSERLSKIICTSCAQSVWSSTDGGRGDKNIECFCLKTHTLKWDGTTQSLLTRCDGFTDKPLSVEE